MPETIINPGTGRKRRQTTRFTPRKRRDPSLNAKRRKWQRHLHGGIALVLNGIFVAGVALAMSYHESILENNPASAEGALLQNIMQALTVYIENSETCYHVLRVLEEHVADIPEDEENQVAYKRPPRFSRINSFQNNDEAKNITNFNKEELIKMIVDHSGLPVWVTVPAGGGTNYSFHREELYLYMLIKLKDGDTHVGLADKTTHGDSRRWSPGYKFIVNYLDERYFDLIGPRGMEIWANHFADFAEAIRFKVGTDEEQFNEDLGVNEIIPGVPFLPGEFGVAMFGDCTEYAICRPHSGPAGDFIGARRRPHWYVFQRAFFGGHHKRHALKTLSYVLPNGMIPAVYGPVSCRRNERLIINWSNVDDSLINLNREVLNIVNPRDWYRAYYDDGIARTFYPCHRSRHQAPLTLRQFQENERMKAMRITVEWSYTQVKALWAVADNHKNKFKLETDHHLIFAQIRLAHLFSNCVTCRRGNQTSTYFGLDAPSLDQYLSMVS
jgi:hypothetical protein